MSVYQCDIFMPLSFNIPSTLNSEIMQKLYGTYVYVFSKNSGFNCNMSFTFSVLSCLSSISLCCCLLVPLNVGQVHKITAALCCLPHRSWCDTTQQGLWHHLLLMLVATGGDTAPLECPHRRWHPGCALGQCSVLSVKKRRSPTHNLTPLHLSQTMLLCIPKASQRLLWSQTFPRSSLLLKKKYEAVVSRRVVGHIQNCFSSFSWQCCFQNRHSCLWSSSWNEFLPREVLICHANCILSSTSRQS